ncbi:hypothetical protein RSAG8_01042, partial [Rhizoctonia solani AG-8 WAC10335]
RRGIHRCAVRLGVGDRKALCVQSTTFTSWSTQTVRSWLTGNAKDIPQGHPWFKSTERAKRYGEIAHLRVHTNNILIMSSYEGILELFEKRGSYCVGFILWGKLIAFTGYGERWKTYRKHANSGFSKTAVVRYHEGQTKDVHTFLQRHLNSNSPEDFAKELNVLIGTIIMRVAYGHQVQEPDEPFMTVSDEAIASMSTAGAARRYLVDSYPFLHLLPTWLQGMGFKLKAQEWSELPYRGTIPMGAKTTDEGKSIPSFLSELLESNEGKYIIKWTVGSMYNAGSHTPVSTPSNFILTVLQYPMFYARTGKGWIELLAPIDCPQCRTGRSYITLACILLETMRWYPVRPLTVPHRVEQEDTYRGYRIPANSTLFANIYAVRCLLPEYAHGYACHLRRLLEMSVFFPTQRNSYQNDSTALDHDQVLIAAMDITKALDKMGVRSNLKW